MMRPLLALVPFALLAAPLALTACAELTPGALGGDPARAPTIDPARVELPECGPAGVPVITGISADWDDVFPDWIALEVRGLTCGADVEGFGFRIFDGDEVDITGRAWPELEALEIDGETFVIRGEAAGCGSFQTAARIEVDAHGVFGTRCAAPVRSEAVSSDLRPFEWPADH